MRVKNKLLYRYFFALFFWGIFTMLAQEQIKILHADQTYKDPYKFEGAIVLNGAIRVQHKGAIMTCEKGLLYPQKNILHAYENVYINQGDTVHQNSDYLKYNGNTLKGIAWGNVKLRDPKMTLTTDTIHLDRITQKAFYNYNGTIVDSLRTLTSVRGNYGLETKKFTASENVIVRGKDSTDLFSEKLDYLLNTKKIFFEKETTIINTAKNFKIQARYGDYETLKKIAHLKDSVRLYQKNIETLSDSLFYNQKTAFSALTGNVKITDTVNKTIITGQYAEYFKRIDSAFVTKKALATKIMKRDSIYMHGDTILMTGKTQKRIIRTYHNAKFFKSNMSGKCDSLYFNEAMGRAYLYKKPVLWSKGSQMTGNVIYFSIKNKQLDSIYIEKNSFIIQKDTLLGEFNQIKGRNMYGQFKQKAIDNFLVKGNGETLYYAKDEKKRPQRH